ncbi:MAG: hypothetical protein ACT6Q8_00945 [Niveispirillum sp.]|uniref:hypothetical protein n=1 Tax=Niveispirillum sp. TaxID=1917217 RepID=UPI0040363DAA
MSLKVINGGFGPGDQRHRGTPERGGGGQSFAAFQGVGQFQQPGADHGVRHDATGGDVGACLFDGACLTRFVHVVEDGASLFHGNEYRTRCSSGQVMGCAGGCCVTFAMSWVWKR